MVPEVPRAADYNLAARVYGERSGATAEKPKVAGAGATPRVTDARSFNLAARVYTMSGLKKVGPGMFALKK